MRFLLISAALALAACAQPSNQAGPAMAAGECRFVDWREAGWRDGAAGLSQAAFDERARVCLAQGVEPDSTAYFQGRVQGLQVYCSPSNGYRLGLEGGEASNICPPGLREQFFAEFNRGRAERAQAGTGEWRTRVGGGVRIGVGSGGVRSGAGVSIGL